MPITKKFLYFLIPSLTFGLGYLIADVKQVNSAQGSSSKQDMESTVNAAAVDSRNDTILDAFLTTGKAQSLGRSQQLSATEKQKIQQFLDKTPESKIEQYLKQAFPDQDLAVIQNKKQFAERILQELSGQRDPSEKLDGRIIISTTAQMPSYSSDLGSIYAQQEVFAHFDTFGKFPNDSQIVIKWMNTDTDEVLLFSPKYIQPNANQNWVSTTPSGGWKKGNYSVTVYQMKDSLAPIAQASYTLHTIIH